MVGSIGKYGSILGSIGRDCNENTNRNRKDDIMCMVVL